MGCVQSMFSGKDDHAKNSKCKSLLGPPLMRRCNAVINGPSSDSRETNLCCQVGYGFGRHRMCDFWEIVIIVIRNTYTREGGGTSLVEKVLSDEPLMLR